MQTEFPRTSIPAEYASTGARGAADCAAATYNVSAPDLTDDELALIDLRYYQFVAQAELDQLMDEL